MLLTMLTYHQSHLQAHRDQLLPRHHHHHLLLRHLHHQLQLPLVSRLHQKLLLLLFLPSGFKNSISLFLCDGFIISDKNVVENGSCLDLPDFHSNVFKITTLINVRHGNPIWVINFWVFPFSLIFGVVNFLWSPSSFIFRIRNRRGFPFTIVFFIPVFWHFCIWVNKGLWLVPFFWLGVFWIVNHSLINPVIWLGTFRVFDLLGKFKFPVVIHGAGVFRFTVDQHVISVI